MVVNVRICVCVLVKNEIRNTRYATFHANSGSSET